MRTNDSRRCITFDPDEYLSHMEKPSHSLRPLRASMDDPDYRPKLPRPQRSSNDIARTGSGQLFESRLLNPIDPMSSSHDSKLLRERLTKFVNKHKMPKDQTKTGVERNPSDSKFDIDGQDLSLKPYLQLPSIIGLRRDQPRNTSYGGLSSLKLKLLQLKADNSKSTKVQYPYRPSIPVPDLNSSPAEDRRLAKNPSAQAPMPSQTPSARDRRREYESNVQESTSKLTKNHVQISRGRVFPMSEIMNLKAYFDELDADKNGVVNTEEMCRHRQHSLLRTNLKLEELLCTVHNDFTFHQMMQKTFPDLSLKDVALCVQAAEDRCNANMKREENKRERNLNAKGDECESVTAELEEVFKCWPHYAPDGSMKFSSFRAFLKSQGDTSKEEDRHVFNSIADPITQLIDLKEFTLWLLNLFRTTKPLTWGGIEEKFLEVQLNMCQ